MRPMFCVIIILVFFLKSCHSQLEITDERLVSYQRCLLDVDCHENSFCFDNDNNKIGRCKCIDGYALLTRNRTYYSCLKLANWEEPCVQDNQCYDYLGNNSTCDGTCKCVDGSYRYPEDGRCYNTVLLNDICYTDGNCRLQNGSYANCYNGRCECGLLYRPSLDRMSCVPARRIGDVCSSEVECNMIPNAVCRELCRCSTGYVISTSQRHCLKAATSFGESCEENGQCSDLLKGSFCNNGSCTCEEGFHGFGSTCARNVGLGEACAGPEECVTDLILANTINCTEGICQCKPGVVDEAFGCNVGQTLPVRIHVLLSCLLILTIHKTFL